MVLGLPLLLKTTAVYVRFSVGPLATKGTFIVFLVNVVKFGVE